MSNKRFLPYCVVIATIFVGCNDELKKSNSNDINNPLLVDYDTNFEVPPFDLIKDEHFRPAFKEALAQNVSEIDSILENSQDASFENTIVALENSGALLQRVGAVFY